MQKNGTIIISSEDFVKGMGDSPLLGNGLIKGIDIFDEPGVIKMAQGTLPSSEAYNSIVGQAGILVADVGDENGYITTLSENGWVYHNDAYLAGTFTKGWDLCVWDNDFVLVSYVNSGSGSIGVISRKTGSAVWHAAKVTSLTTTHNIKLLKGQDGYVYFTNGRYIGKITAISETAGTVTVTSTSNALDLTAQVYATTLAELGSDLIIGTQKGINSTAKIDFLYASLFRWDRTSASFRLPIYVNEFGINAMASKNNLVYFSAGVWGNIYVTDGTSVQLVKRIPYTSDKGYGATCDVMYNALTFNQRGNLLVGVSTNSDNTPNTTSQMGIYEIQLSQGYPAVLAYMGVGGQIGQNDAVIFGFVRPVGVTSVRYGARDSYTSVDRIMISSSGKVTNGRAEFSSPLYIVGDRLNRKSYQNLTITLSEPTLQTGDLISIYYRKNIKGAWTSIVDRTITDPFEISYTTKALIADAEMVQIKISLTPSGTSSTQNIKLLRLAIS